MADQASSTVPTGAPVGPQLPEAAEQPAQSPEAKEAPTQTWICENPRCKYAGVKRTVRMAHLGQGLYLMGAIRCQCGSLPVKDIQRGGHPR